MSDKRVSCKPEDLCDALFMHLAGNLQSMLPVVKLQVFLEYKHCIQWEKVVF